MRKVQFLQQENHSFPFTDVSSLRRLLHTRWLLSDKASLSLFREEDGLCITVLDDEAHAPLSQALRQAEAIVREAAARGREIKRKIYPNS